MCPFLLCGLRPSSDAPNDEHSAQVTAVEKWVRTAGDNDWRPPIHQQGWFGGSFNHLCFTGLHTLEKSDG